ncbi:MAG: winged helix-turn-helix domain-containing protein [Nitrososphaera sp.]
MRHRSRTDIVSQILDTSNVGATKTQIRDAVLLSPIQLDAYINALVKAGLLEVSLGNKYKTTPEGLQIIASLEKLDKLAID